MNTLRRSLALVAAVLGVALSAGSVPSQAVVTPVDARCSSHAPIPAAALAHGASWGCSLVGRTVYAGRVAAVVPPPGVTVAGEGVGTRGDVAGLQVSNDAGVVRATVDPAGARQARQGVVRAARSATNDPCKDRTFHLEGHRWTTSYRYGINLAKAPRQLSKKTLTTQIKAANTNMRKGRNSCGLKALGTPVAHYTGKTKAVPNVKPGATRIKCGAFNRTNVVGFGNLHGNLLGWTCYWWLGDQHLAGADIMIDRGNHLVTKIPSGCTNKWDFEGTVTHEFGHVYGMGHSGRSHPTLTMDHLETACSTYARTLGLGDWLGMKKMYGLR